MGSGPTYKKRIRPSAADEFLIFCRTYGHDFQVKAKCWCAGLVTHVKDREVPPFDCQINGMLETILTEHSQLVSSWEVSFAKFKESASWERIRKFAYFITHLQPPSEIRVAVSRFDCLAGVELELHAYYEVDHTNQIVIFDKFEVYSTQ